MAEDNEKVTMIDFMIKEFSKLDLANDTTCDLILRFFQVIASFVGAEATTHDDYKKEMAQIKSVTNIIIDRLAEVKLPHFK